MVKVDKWGVLFGIVLSAIPLYFWKKYFLTLAALQEELKENQLFYKKHNCVVMYFKKRGVTGWPNCTVRLQEDLINIDALFEPIVHFISTAEKTLDIAIMMIHTFQFVDAILEARSKGVKVRIIMDYSCMKDHTLIMRQFRNKGVQALYYVSPKIGIESILHYKYMVKDYSKNEGFVYLGSLNWTMSGLFNNYENIVFTSNRSVVEALHQNFEDTWKFVEVASNYLDVKAVYNLP